jgi:hypothetical protein
VVTGREAEDKPVCMRAFSFKDHFENSDRRELAGVGFLAVRYLTIIHAVRPYLKLYSRAIATQRTGSSCPCKQR